MFHPPVLTTAAPTLAFVPVSDRFCRFIPILLCASLLTQIAPRPTNPSPESWSVQSKGLTSPADVRGRLRVPASFGAVDPGDNAP